MMNAVPLTEEKPNWFYRRVIIFGTLIFSAVALAYLIVKASSDPLREELALGILTLDGTIITGYVFGAVWDDMNFMKYRFPQSPYGQPGMPGQMPGMMPGMPGMMPPPIGMPPAPPGMSLAIPPAPPAPPMATAVPQTGALPLAPGGALSAAKKPKPATPLGLAPPSPNEGCL